MLDLNNFPDELYERLRDRARRERRSVAQEVTHLLASILEAQESRSILELLVIPLRAGDPALADRYEEIRTPDAVLLAAALARTRRPITPRHAGRAPAGTRTRR